jgi:hypothetical protein
MTESEWLSCTDPMPMLEYLRGKASHRKCWLFAAACWDRMLRLDINDNNRELLAFCERAAIGDLPNYQVMEAIDAAWTTSVSITDLPQIVPRLRIKFGGEAAAHCLMLRDIFGNPFYSLSIGFHLLTPKVVSLAQTIYDDRAFERLPVLADALEDAGCDNTDILNHCRSKGPHVRGCFVLELLLGNE